MRTTPLLLAASLSLFLAVACNSERHGRSPAGSSAGSNEGQSTSQGTVTIKGSDTMVILGQRWAEAFMKKNSGASVQVSGGGSGTGIAALINGTADVVQSSRPIKDREIEQVKERRKVAPVEFAVALDALAVYVHEKSPLEALTIEQVRKIFRGEIKNWKEVGGPDAGIVLYSRENNSGTYVYFKEHVLEDKDFAPQTQTLPGTAAVINAVSRDVNGIGYGGIAYGEGIRELKLAAEAGGETVAPSLENAVNGTYPLARSLFVYTAGSPEGLARRYIDFVLSPDGQKVVEGVGYYPLPEPTRVQSLKALEQPGEKRSDGAGDQAAGR